MSPMILLLLAIFLLQPQTTAEPTTTELFVSDDERLAFVHPADWQVTEDAPDIFFIENPDALAQATPEPDEPDEAVSILLQIADFAPQGDDPDLGQLLQTLFGDEDYSDPQPVQVNDARTAFTISSAAETILAFQVSAENVALLFIIGPEEARASDSVSQGVALIAGSMLYGDDVVDEVLAALGESTAAPQAEPVTEIPGFTRERFPFDGGSLTLSYPETWLAESFPEAGLVLTDEEENFAFLLNDITFALESYGGTGRPSDLREADVREIIAAFVGEETANQSGLIDVERIGSIEFARLDLPGVEDITGDSALIALKLDETTPALLVFTTDTGELIRYNSIIESIIGSMVYAPTAE